MPTYEYKCDACGAEFERFQSITAEPVRKCPECKKRKVRRLISTGAGLIFKGSGFYITDYRDQSYADKAKADSGGGAETKTDAKSDAKGDAKSETKPDAKPAQPATAKPAETKPEPKPTASSSAKKESRSPKKKSLPRFPSSRR